METITTSEISSKRLLKNSSKRREQFVKANQRYLEKGNNREIQRERCRQYGKKYYLLKCEIKRLSGICY